MSTEEAQNPPSPTPPSSSDPSSITSQISLLRGSTSSWNLSHDADLCNILTSLSAKFQLTASATANRLRDLEEEVEECKVNVRGAIGELQVRKP